MKQKLDFEDLLPFKSLSRFYQINIVFLMTSLFGFNFFYVITIKTTCYEKLE
jgi:hypothetical protein